MLSDLITFYRLARARFKSDIDYIEFQRFQARNIICNLRKEGIVFEGKRILDLGCGKGGYSIELGKAGGIVFSLDLNVENTTNHSEESIRSFFLVYGNATSIPFKNEIFDIVFCSSLVEHIENKEKLLSEIWRILSKNGIIYLSFPPFFSPFGGHHYSPFHYLGERAAIFFGELRNKNLKFSSFKEYGLFPITVRRAKKLIKEFFFIKTIRTRFLPINTTILPLIDEFFTWHVEFILKKVVE